METLNLNFDGCENILKSICWVLSVLSWVLFIVTGWMSIYWFQEGKDFIPYIWTIMRISTNTDIINYAPLQMQIPLIYIVIIITMVIAFAGFIIYMIKSTCKKDEQVYEGMIGQWSKFHFFPLLCASALFIIGICTDSYKDRKNHTKNMYICSIVFSFVGLCSLIFIYIMTELNNKWYIVLTIKKGTFSCLIVLMWYMSCYNIYYIRLFDKPNEWGRNRINWERGCGLGLSIIFGTGTIIFSFIFKDIVMAVMTILIYIGMTIYYFKIPKGYRNSKDLNKNGDGIVDIIMMVILVVLISFLILKYKTQCFNS